MVQEERHADKQTYKSDELDTRNTSTENFICVCFVHPNALEIEKSGVNK